MATKPIKGSEIIEVGALDNHIKQLKELKGLYEQLDADVSKLATQSKKAANGFKANQNDDVKRAIQLEKQLTAEIVEQEKRKKALIQTNQTLEKLEQDKERTLQQQIVSEGKLADAIGKEEQMLKKKTTRLREEEKLKQDALNTTKKQLDLNDKEIRQQKKLEAEALKLRKAKLDENNVYKQQSKTLTDLINRYQNLAARGRENGKVARGMLTEITKLDAGLKKIDATVGRHQRNVGNYQSALTGLGNTYRSLIGLASQLGLAMGTGMIVRNGFNTLVEFDEKLADIAKTTGLTIEGARSLSNELLTIDTRTSVTNLQELAVAAGRLGITGTENILGFAEAADKVFVALADDLSGSADEIATSLGKISSLFGLEEEFGIGGGIERVGSAINELSANSKAAAEPILDFTSRMAGVASQANISASDIMALGALFSGSGQSIEVASTTLIKLLPKLASEQEKYSKVAGMTSEAFSEMLKNNPIEALKSVAVGARSSKGGLEGLVETLGDFGADSARAASIVGVLAAETDELTRLQEISYRQIIDNNSVTDEFNIKNQTTGALLEKLSKEWDKQILGIGGTSNVSKTFKNVLGFLINNLSTIVNLAMTAAKAWLAYKATILSLQAVEKVSNVLMIARTGGLKALFVQQTAVNTATATGTKTMNIFNKTVKANPIGLLISGLVTLISLFADFNGEVEDQNAKLEEANRLMEENNKQVAESIRLRNILNETQQDASGQLANVRALSDERLLALKSEILEQEGLINDLSKEAFREAKLRSEEQIKEEGKLIASAKLLNENKKEAIQLEKDLKSAIDFDSQIKLNSETTQGFESRTVEQLKLEESKKIELSTQLEINKKLKEAENTTTNQLTTETGLNFINQEQERLKASQLDKVERIVKQEKELTEIQKEQLRLIEEEIKRRKLKDKGSSTKQLTGLAKMEKERSDLEKKRSDLLVKNGGLVTKDFITMTNQSNELERQINAYKLVLEKVEKINKVQAEGLKIETERGKSTLALGDVDLRKVGKQGERKTAGDLEAEAEAEAQRIEAQKQMAQNLTDLTVALANRRIEALERENQIQQQIFQQSMNREQQIIARREANNSSLESSLAFEKQAQSKALQEQEKIAKKKARIEIFMNGMQMLNSYVQQGKDVGNVIGDMTVLTSALEQMVPALWSGTDTTVGDAIGVKYSNKRDGVLARIDPSEMVLNKTKVDTLAKYGVNSTDDIVRRVQMGSMFNVPSVTNSKPIIINDVELLKSQKETNNLLQQIASKPTSQLDIHQLDRLITISERISTPTKVTTTIKHKRLGR